MAGGGNHNDAGLNVHHGPTAGAVPPAPSGSKPHQAIVTSCPADTNISLDEAYRYLSRKRVSEGPPPRRP